MYFDRFDICAAHWLFATLYHGGQGCPIYRKLGQLENLRFRPSPLWSDPRDLEQNAREIFRQLVVDHCGLHTTCPS